MMPPSSLTTKVEHIEEQLDDLAMAFKAAFDGASTNSFSNRVLAKLNTLDIRMSKLEEAEAEKKKDATARAGSVLAIFLAIGSAIVSFYKGVK